MEQPKKKGAGKDPEFMAMMRVRANEARKRKAEENKKLKEAQSLLKKKENEELLKKAEAIKNPKPVAEPVTEKEIEPTPEPVFNEPIEPKTSRKKKPVIIDSDNEELDYKSAYYKAKLKKIKQPSTPQQPIPQEIAFDVAKSSVKQHFNKAMMGQLWRTYFGSEDCPY
jgi:hypothetical protein